MKRLYTILITLFLFNLTTQAQTPNVDFTQVVATGGISRPVFVTHCGDDRIFVVGKNGTIRIVNHPDETTYNLVTTPFLNITSSVLSSGNEQGLLGLAFHPDYKNNGYFYVHYNAGSGNGISVIERYSVSAADSNLADAASGVILLTQTQPFTNHKGGCMQFGADGYLYIAFGDGGSGGDPGNRAQRIDTLLGKILRIDVNNPNPPYYSIPPTNPFVNNPAARHEIWSYGLRNTWRFSFDRITGDMWMGDVGQDVWEEIDFEAANDTGGHNYGWRCFEGTHAYNMSGGNCPVDSGTLPVFEYAHSASLCSVTGGYVYRGAQINSLYGQYLYADYCDGTLEMLTNNNGTYTSTALIPGAFTISSFGEDKWGELYACSYTNGTNGKVYKITDLDCAPVAEVLSDTTIYYCSHSPTELKAIEGQGLFYQWLYNGNPIPGAQSSTYVLADTGSYQLVVTNPAVCSTISQTIHVLPSVAADATIQPVADICSDSFGAQLQVATNGGTFTGVGVDPTTGFFNPFSPNVQYGLQTVTYVINDSGNCGADTVTFNYIAPPIITLSYTGAFVNPNTFCTNWGPADLFADSTGGTFTSSIGTITGNSLLIPSSVTADTLVIIYYQFTDDHGCTSITVDSLNGVICDGINQLNNKSFNVYPNPATSEIHIDFYTSHQGVDAALFDVNGKKVESFSVAKNQNQVVHSIDQLADGVYMLRLSSADGVSYIKVLKSGE